MSDEPQQDQEEAAAGIPYVTIGVIVVRGELRDGKKLVTVQVQCADENLDLMRRAVKDFTGEVRPWETDNFIAQAAVQFGMGLNHSLDKAVTLAYALQERLRKAARERDDAEVKRLRVGEEAQADTKPEGAGAGPEAGAGTGESS